MKVFKFGGASIKDVQSIERLPGIISNNSDNELIIVVSALGKTTNKIETIVNKAFKHDLYSDELSSLKDVHLQMYRELVGHDCQDLLKLFDDFEHKIITTNKSNYDYFYDQIVSYGEQFSSYMVYKYLCSKGFDIQLINACDVVVSDENWRRGNVDEAETHRNVDRVLKEKTSQIIITQGFIAATRSRDVVTLGREGSDYSASLFAAFSGADELTFWKDVAGIYTSDPSVYEDAKLLDVISYNEMVELSYFGAKILHKKTLSVLNDRNVVTKVKSFLTPDEPGTTLLKNIDCMYPPLKILLKNQILITVQSKDKSIIAGNDLQVVYNIAAKLKIDINLIQVSAIKISFCVTYNDNSFAALLDLLSNYFVLKYNNGMVLETIRHYTNDELVQIISRSDVLLTQITRSVVQFVYRS